MAAPEYWWSVVEGAKVKAGLVEKGATLTGWMFDTDGSLIEVIFSAIETQQWSGIRYYKWCVTLLVQNDPRC